jgi:DNA-directed RNA polymerase specialized sigma24 family protein
MAIRFLDRPCRVHTGFLDCQGMSERTTVLMSAPGSITHWIEQAQAGNAQAAQKLWEFYFQRLVGLARKKLHSTRVHGADEEDVALSTFDSMFRGLEAGRFPQLDDRDNLWRLLVVITARKVINQDLHEGCQKRGGGAVLGESAILPAGSDAETAPAMQQVIGREPSPEFAAQVAEEYEQLLQRLDDPQLRSIAVWKMEGYSNQEIAAQLGSVVRTVERKLRRIRSIWSDLEPG